jgi:hypothetical protein
MAGGHPPIPVLDISILKAVHGSIYVGLRLMPDCLDWHWYAPTLNEKSRDGSQPSSALSRSPSGSAGSRSLHRLVRVFPNGKDNDQTTLH